MGLFFACLFAKVVANANKLVGQELYGSAQSKGGKEALPNS